MLSRHITNEDTKLATKTKIAMKESVSPDGFTNELY